MKPLAGVFLLFMTLYALIDCARTPDARMKAIPKPLWFVAIVLIPLLGPVAWLVAGKIPTERPQLSAPGMGPDDDPSFLRKLDDETWRSRRDRHRNGGTSGTDGRDDADPEDPPPAAV